MGNSKIGQKLDNVPEVLSSLGDGLAVQAEDDSSKRLSTMFNVKVDLNTESHERLASTVPNRVIDVNPMQFLPCW